MENNIEPGDIVYWKAGSKNLFRVESFETLAYTRYDSEVISGKVKAGDTRVWRVKATRIATRLGTTVRAKPNPYSRQHLHSLPIKSIMKVDPVTLEAIVRAEIAKLEASIPKFNAMFEHEARLKRARVLK